MDQHVKQKKRNWYMFFRKITLIFASILSVVGFVLVLVVSMVDWVDSQNFFLGLIVYTVAPFFIVWGVYYVIYVLYRLFRWAWKSTEEE